MKSILFSQSILIKAYVIVTPSCHDALMQQLAITKRLHVQWVHAGGRGSMSCEVHMGGRGIDTESLVEQMAAATARASQRLRQAADGGCSCKGPRLRQQRLGGGSGSLIAGSGSSKGVMEASLPLITRSPPA